MTEGGGYFSRNFRYVDVIPAWPSRAGYVTKVGRKDQWGLVKTVAKSLDWADRICGYFYNSSLW